MALTIGFQEQVANHRKRLWSKARVASASSHCGNHGAPRERCAVADAGEHGPPEGSECRQVFCSFWGLGCPKKF